MERRKGPYSLHKRPTKHKNIFKYYVRFRDQHTGKYRSALSTGCTRRDDAVRWAERRLAEDSKTRSDITFAQYAEGFWEIGARYAQTRWASGKTISSGTLQTSTGNTVKHLLPMWGPYKLTSITTGAVKDWLLSKKKIDRLSAATINKLLYTLRTILKQAVDDAIIPIDPTQNIQAFTGTTEERGSLELPELQRLFSSLEYWDDETYFVISLLAACTGMRMGEVRGLRVEAIGKESLRIDQSWEEGHGRKEPKCGSIREVPIAPELHTILSDFIRKTGVTDLVFRGTAKNGNPFSKSVIEKHFNRALSKIGISESVRRERGLSFHGLRHTLITLLVKNEVADAKIKSITGHSSREVQDRYTHLKPSDITELVTLQHEIMGTYPEWETRTTRTVQSVPPFPYADTVTSGTLVAKDLLPGNRSTVLRAFSLN